MKPSFTVAQFTGNPVNPADSNPPLPAELGRAGHNKPKTDCILATGLVRWLRGNPKYMLQPVLVRGRALPSSKPNYAYITVKEGAFGGNSKSFYLHTLLCFLYRGPPPPLPLGQARWVAGHICHHKACIAPWHIIWMSDSHNVKMGKVHKRKRDYAPPFVA